MFEDRRKKRNIWRKYAMLFGFNMRNSGRDYPDHRRSSFRVEPGCLLKRGNSDFRRRFSVADWIPVIAVIITMIAFTRCLFGDCKALELVIQVLLRPLTGSHL
jgi:hypothetical protein